jgi:signal transduction histidine kinase
MEPDVVQRARERAQDLIFWIEDAVFDLRERQGADALARGQELATWLQATTTTALRELAPHPTSEPAPSSLVKDVSFILDLLIHGRPDGEVEIELAARATPYIRGDRWTVRRLLLDVLLDARAAEARGGKLRIEISAEKDEAVLRVVNKGRHLPKLDRPRTPTPRSLERDANLIKASRLLEQLGGTLSVEGELGGGLTVTIRLPLLATRLNAVDALPQPTGPETRTSAWPKNEPTSPCA